jgi:hypothetical protein
VCMHAHAFACVCAFFLTKGSVFSSSKSCNAFSNDSSGENNKYVE